MSAPGWQWDPAVRLWYSYDRRAGYEIFETGARRESSQIPRNIPIGSRAPPSTTQYSSSPTTRSSAYEASRVAPAGASGDAGSGNANDKRPVARHDRADSAQAPLVYDFARVDLSAKVPTPLHNEEKEWTAPNGDRFLKVTNPANEVQTTIKLGPVERITDPALYNQGIRATQMLLPTEGETERLFADYKRREQPRRFFTRGKVFRVLWSEPAGDNRTAVTHEAPGIFAGRFGERVHSKVRLFVVIREGKDYCSALPILSYGGQGVSKRGVVKSEHSVIYSGKTAPEPFQDEAPARGEEGMRPDAIRVNPDDRADALQPRSRIDYGKVYTIEHNIKVKPYGQVHPQSEAAFRHQFLNVWLGEAAAGAVTQTSSHSTTTNPITGTRSNERQSLHRDSRSTSAAAANSSRPKGAATSAAALREAQAKAAVQRLMQQGKTEQQAVKIVRDAARTMQQGSKSQREEDSSGENSATSSGESDESHAQSSSGRATTTEHPDKTVGITSSQQHPTRPSGSLASPVMVPGRNEGRTQVPIAYSSSPPGLATLRQQASTQAPSPAQQHGQGQSRAQPAQTQGSSNTQAQAVYQQLIERGYTREQALSCIATGMARQGGGQQR